MRRIIICQAVLTYHCQLAKLYNLIHKASTTEL